MIIHSEKYRAIVMDPPWAFRTFGGDNATPHRSLNEHYQTMELHEIAGLPVPALADKSCALFMWVVSSHIDAGIELMNMWGFSLKSLAFVWVKSKIGAAEQGALFLEDAYDDKHPLSMGYWTRQQTELCLLATKGKPAVKDRGVRQLIIAPRREHSRKPDETFARAGRLVDGPYLEMFARQRRPGWSAWGNETEKFEAVA